MLGGFADFDDNFSGTSSPFSQFYTNYNLDFNQGFEIRDQQYGGKLFAADPLSFAQSETFAEEIVFPDFAIPPKVTNLYGGPSPKKATNKKSKIQMKKKQISNEAAIILRM